MKTTLEKIIADLEHFRGRIGMFVAHVDVANVHTFLMGFHYALRAVGFSYEGKGYSEVCAERGYANEPTGLVPQMQRRGMDDKAIMDELILLEIEGFRRQLGHVT